MKKIVACFKWVVDEADIKIEGWQNQLNFDQVKYKISEYDRNALELGARLSENLECEFIAVTCGTDVEGALKDALSRGPQSIYYLMDPVLADADSSVTAKVLSGVIKSIGAVDLVICGEGSGDFYAQQVGPRLAALLKYPCISYVNKIEVTQEAVKMERKLEDGVEVVEVSGPAVITVLPDINKPRIPSLKQILAAKKKPAYEVSLASIGLTEDNCQPKLTSISLAGAVMNRKGIRINGNGISPAEAAKKLVQQLANDGVLN